VTAMREIPRRQIPKIQMGETASQKGEFRRRDVSRAGARPWRIRITSDIVVHKTTGAGRIAEGGRRSYGRILEKIKSQGPSPRGSRRPTITMER